MKLVKNWGKIAKRAHSMLAFYLSFVVLLLPEVIFYIWERDTNPKLWWAVAAGLLVYGAVSRLVDQGIDQPDEGRRVKSPPWIAALAVLALSAVFVAQGTDQRPPAVDRAAAPEAHQVEGHKSDFLAMAVPFIGRWEGLRLVAYQDIVGVWTVCYGETNGVKPGDRHTKAECDEMFGKQVLRYRSGLHQFFTPETIAQRLPVPRDVAFVSLAYNVGVAGAGKSTAVKRLNSADVAGACTALTWWNKAGGRVVRGLINRRSEEYDLCMQGVA